MSQSPYPWGVISLADLLTGEKDIMRHLLLLLSIKNTIGIRLLNPLMLRSYPGGSTLSAKIGEERPGKEKYTQVNTTCIVFCYYVAIEFWSTSTKVL